MVVSAPQGATGQLRLRWNHSDIINAQRSSLTVVWDGRPLRTVRLSREKTDITLRNVKGGYHQLELLAHLVDPEDPCLLTNPDGVWLRIDPISDIEWQGRKTSKKPLQSLRLWPSSWRKAGIGQVMLPFSSELTKDLTAAQAVMEALLFLRKQGFQVIPWSRQLRTIPIVRLEVLSNQRRAIDPEARAHAHLDGRTLTLSSTTAEGLLD